MQPHVAHETQLSILQMRQWDFPIHATRGRKQCLGRGEYWPHHQKTCTCHSSKHPYTHHNSRKPASRFAHNHKGNKSPEHKEHQPESSVTLILYCPYSLVAARDVRLLNPQKKVRKRKWRQWWLHKCVSHLLNLMSWDVMAFCFVNLVDVLHKDKQLIVSPGHRNWFFNDEKTKCHYYHRLHTCQSDNWKDQIKL